MHSFIAFFLREKLSEDKLVLFDTVCKVLGVQLELRNSKNHFVVEIEEDRLSGVVGASAPADEPSRQVCEELLGSKERTRVVVMDIWVIAARETRGDSAAKA